MSAPPSSTKEPTSSVGLALSQLLTLPNLGLNLFLAAAFLLFATGGRPTVWTTVLVLVAFLGARNAGHAFNQLVDRKLDAQNPRTRHRPVVTGAISPRFAAGAVVVNAGLFFVAAYLLRPWLVLLALPALGLVLGYSYTKRWTAATTVVLGAVQGLIPAGVYLAVDGSLPEIAWAAVGAMILFGTAFESVHSLGDLDADRALGLHSLPLEVGEGNAPLLVAALLTAALALLLGYGVAVDGPSHALLLAWAGMGAVALWEVHGLRTGKVPLLSIFRGHFAMGALFLAGAAAAYFVPGLGSGF